jgi:hypothetical protein
MSSNGANKGGKKKRRGKNTTDVSKPFAEPMEKQYFAKAIKALGANKVQLEVYFYNIENRGKKNEKITFKSAETVIGCVRGSMRRREYVNPGCIVLVSEREFSASQKVVDIILLYKPYHYNQIKNHKLSPGNIISSDISNNEGGVEFEASEPELDSDGEIATIDYTKTVKRKKKDNKNEDYMASIELPSFDDNDDFEETTNSNRECDIYGNYI